MLGGDRKLLLGDNYVFIHVPKTAGTSIQYALSEYKYKRPLHLGRDKDFPDHITYTDLEPKHKVGRFSFGFVRNPWDWARSLYYFVLKYSNKRRWASEVPQFQAQGMNNWICNAMMPWLKKHTRWYQEGFSQFMWVDGVDFIGQFEYLNRDFRTICERLNYPDLYLTHKIVSTSGSYRDEYGNEAKDYVARVFAKDIDKFNYTF